MFHERGSRVRGYPTEEKKLEGKKEVGGGGGGSGRHHKQYQLYAIVHRYRGPDIGYRRGSTESTELTHVEDIPQSLFLLSR
jgi:hypothetical protein